MNKPDSNTPQPITVFPALDLPFLIGEVVISTRSWTRFIIAEVIFGVTNAIGDMMLVATDGRALEPAEAIRTGNFCELDADGKPIEPVHEDDVLAPAPDKAPILEGFTRVDDALPGIFRPVLGLRRSADSASRYEIVTCHVTKSQSPLYRWRCHGNDAVLAPGFNILAWRYADDWLMPTP